MMRRHTIGLLGLFALIPLVVCSVSSCAPDGMKMPLPDPAQKLFDGAVLAALSDDQSLLAAYKAPRLLGIDQMRSGTLLVKALPAGLPAKLDDAAFGASFGLTGNVLHYYTEPVASVDVGSTVYYGALHHWNPRLAAPVRLSRNFAVQVATTADHAAVLFLDAPRAAGVQAGELVLVRDADCAGSTCQSLTVQSAVEAHGLGFSNQGRFAAFSVRTPSVALGFMWETFLVDVASGRVTSLARTQVPARLATRHPFHAFTPDESMIAVIGTAMGGAVPQIMAIQVFDTTTLAQVSWGRLLPNLAATQLAFTDRATLYVEGSSSPADLAIFKTTAASASPFLVATDFAVPALASTQADAGRYLFVSTSAESTFSGGLPFRVSLVDLQALLPSAVPLASSAAAYPVISDDLRSARFIDNFDNDGRIGALTVADLPSGATTVVALGIGPFDGSFAQGTSRLLYKSGGDASGAGTLTAWNGDGRTTVEKGVDHWHTGLFPSRLYFSLTGPNPPLLRSPGIYSEAMP